jgi:hypothetical protein
MRFANQDFSGPLAEKQLSAALCDTLEQPNGIVHCRDCLEMAF